MQHPDPKWTGARGRNDKLLASNPSLSSKFCAPIQVHHVGTGERPKRFSTVPTTDHDEGLPPLYGAPLGVLVPVLIDRRWMVLPPGDPVAQHLVGAEAGGGHA